MTEKILLTAKPGPQTLILPTILLILGLGCSICMLLLAVVEPGSDRLSNEDIGAILFCLIPIGLLFSTPTIIAFLKISTNKLILTDQHLISQAGIFGQHTRKIKLSAIAHIDYVPSLFGNGIIIINGLRSVQVRDPYHVTETIKEAI